MAYGDDNDSGGATDGNRALRAQLDVLDEALAGLEQRVLSNDEILETLESSLVSEEELRCRHEVRRAEVESRRAALWVRLLELQAERDALKEEEANLDTELDQALADRKDAVVRYREAERTGAGLERELAEVKARRRQLGQRLAATTSAPHATVPPAGPPTDDAERDPTNRIDVSSVVGDSDADEIELDVDDAEFDDSPSAGAPLRLVTDEHSSRRSPPPPPAAAGA